VVYLRKEKIMISKYIKSLKSHPDKTLIDHIIGVKDRGLTLLSDYRVRTCALFHDVGKMTKNFQIKLAGENVTGLYSNHAYLSYYTLLNYVAQYRCRPGLVTNKEDLILIGTCILKHHGGLPNLPEIINIEEWDRMKAFLLTNPFMPADELLSALGLDRDALHFSLQEIPLKNIISGNRGLYSSSSLRSTINDPLRFFFDLKMCFSAIVAADKGDAGRHKITTEATRKIEEVYKTRINTYLNSFNARRATELNAVRTEIRDNCITNLSQAMTDHPDQHTFSLTEPTGSGKTAILLTLANEIMQRKRVSKVIYSIPFLSITEQVYGIIEDIFNSEQGCLKRIDCKAQPEFDASEIYDDYGEENLLKKLKSMMRKIFKGKTIRDEAVENLLREDYQESTFDYPLIVTTFVQFFQSFTTASNKGLMRFSSLQNSVFLIDEIQALPSRLYSFFVALLDEFCRRYNSYAIISTATMPSFDIPSNAKDARNMFRNYRCPIEIGNIDHFNREVFNRYELHVDKIRTGIKGLVSRIIQETEPTLVVLNTINDSRRVYEALKASANCPVKLMNSNFHSKDRRTILSRCQAMLDESRLSGTKFFFVTTQLIEAGVDIDFPVMYRDIAPLPNLIQTSGRCNREGLLRNPDGSRRRGVVNIFLLKEDNKNMLRAQYIYNGLDSSFLDYAIRVLVSVPQQIFEERDLFNLQRGYFTYMSQRLIFGAWEKDSKHCDFVQQIRDFKFKEIGAYTVIPAKQYGIQERFYVPINGNDDSYERLLELLAEKENLDQLGSQAGKDTLREIIFRGTQVHGHLKKMMDRVVQVNIADTDLKSMVVYENQCCYMYKLKPGFYTVGPDGHSEYGLLV
jgi:CRISPR-associated endonuclease/helicase Cas3